MLNYAAGEVESCWLEFKVEVLVLFTESSLVYIYSSKKCFYDRYIVQQTTYHVIFRKISYYEGTSGLEYRRVALEHKTGNLIYEG